MTRTGGPFEQDGGPFERAEVSSGGVFEEGGPFEDWRHEGEDGNSVESRKTKAAPSSSQDFPHAIPDDVQFFEPNLVSIIITIVIPTKTVIIIIIKQFLSQYTLSKWNSVFHIMEFLGPWGWRFKDRKITITPQETPSPSVPYVSYQAEHNPWLFLQSGSFHIFISSQVSSQPKLSSSSSSSSSSQITTDDEL